MAKDFYIFYTGSERTLVANFNFGKLNYKLYRVRNFYVVTDHRKILYQTDSSTIAKNRYYDIINLSNTNNLNF